MLSRQTKLYASVMKWLTAVLGVLLLAIMVGVLGKGSFEILAAEYVPPLQQDAKNYWLKLRLLQIVSLVPMIMTLMVLVNMFKLFSLISVGEIFSDKAVKSIRGIGTFLILLTVTVILSGSASSIIVSFDNPTGEKELSIGVSSHNLILLTLGIVVRFLGQAMVEALKVQEENRQFV